MDSKKNYTYAQIIKKIKSFFECKLHISYKYKAYCYICKQNICDKCLNNNITHIGHEIIYFKKILLSEKQTKYYQTLFFLCKFYLNRVKEIIIELIVDITDIIEKTDKNTENYTLLLNFKSQLKNTYKHFYKINTYERHYAKNILALYFYCRKWGYINYQIIKNIYDVKINSVKIPELDDKDLFTKMQIMIDFMKNSKNNILRSSDSDYLSTFYSYIDYNCKNPKVNTYSVRLSSISFDINKGEIYFIQDDINKSFSIETNETDYNRENNNNSNNNINDLEQMKEENNLIKNIDNLKKLLFSRQKEDIDINIKNINININNNSPKDKISNYNNINTFKICKIDEGEDNNKYIINNKLKNLKIQYRDILDYESKINNIKENQNININIINNEEEEKEIKIKNNKKIKKLIYSNLPKSCNEEVEYRNEIPYKYFDKNEKKEIYSVYYGEFKKGTLKRHGRGLFIWEDKEFYLGYWANDKREGEGTNTYSNGNIYQGNYKNGKKDGDGIYKWKNGDKYKGKWKNDMKDGKGVYEYSNGDIYNGFFKMDKIDGNGVYTWANKFSYKGVFKNNLIVKKGYLSYLNNDAININKINDNKNKDNDNKDE